jgi:UDP-2,3-diacylglucosamine pyrophosphatase LpxH
MLLCLLTSCERHDAKDTVIDPFTNNSNVRNMIVVMSDLHMGADLSYAEINENLSSLEKLLNQIRVSPNVKELVFAGDFLDEWYVPATIDTYAGQGQSGFVQRIATTNSGVIEALNQIIQAGEILVTYVPGNHDMAVTAENIAAILPGINQARDAEQGLGTYSPAGHTEIAIEHGHRYNIFCAPDPISNQDISPGAIQPAGYFLTRLAALHIAQNCHIAADTIQTITPNVAGGDSQYSAFLYYKFCQAWLGALPIENMFDENIIVTNTNGFTGSYSVNDVLPHQLTEGGFIDMHLYKGFQDNWDALQTRNHVPVHIPAAQAIPEALNASYTDQQAGTQYFMNPSSDKRIVVFGHSHAAKITASNNYNGQKSIYANTGTWIDNNQGLTTMNFVVITPQFAASAQTYVRLYNYEGEVVTKMGFDSARF